MINEKKEESSIVHVRQDGTNQSQQVKFNKADMFRILHFKFNAVKTMSGKICFLNS